MLSKFQDYLLDTLLTEPLKAFKLRQKNINTFDKMFTEVFGKSFGCEIEINPSLYKKYYPQTYNSDDHIDILSFKRKINSIESSMTPMFEAKTYMDYPCAEYTFPIRPQNLHVVYKALRKIQKYLVCELGSSFDTSSSMHIHSLMHKTPKQISVHPDLKKAILSSRKKFILNYSSCTIVEKHPIIVTPDHNNNSNFTLPCGECMGCGSVKDIVKSYFTKPKLRGNISDTPFRMAIYANKGIECSREAYEEAFDLLYDHTIVNKLKYVFGIQDTTVLNICMNDLLIAFAPYTTAILRHSYNAQSIVQWYKNWHTAEIRVFGGTTDLRLILMRAMLSHALINILYYKDTSLLNAFVERAKRLL